jgi:hypothetical protein
VARAGLAEKVVPLSEMGAEIVRRTRKIQAPARVGKLTLVRSSL